MSGCYRGATWMCVEKTNWIEAHFASVCIDIISYYRFGLSLDSFVGMKKDL